MHKVEIESVCRCGPKAGCTQNYHKLSCLSGVTADVCLQNFWGRLGSKFGTKFYWQDKGEGSAIVNAVSAIDFCAREPISKLQCSRIQGELGDEPSAGPIDSILSKFGK